MQRCLPLYRKTRLMSSNCTPVNTNCPQEKPLIDLSRSVELKQAIQIPRDTAKPNEERENKQRALDILTFRRDYFDTLPKSQN